MFLRTIVMTAAAMVGFAGAASAATPSPKCDGCIQGYRDCVREFGESAPVCVRKQATCVMICEWEVPYAKALPKQNPVSRGPGLSLSEMALSQPSQQPSVGS